MLNNKIDSLTKLLKDLKREVYMETYTLLKSKP